jgi:hypothetical protein
MKIIGGFQQAEQPIQYRIGTNSEAFAYGEILALSSGVLTKAGVDTSGSQQFICMGAATGATGVANVPVVQLRKDLQFSCVSTATVAATLVGTAVTLDSTATTVTATGTNGCFIIDKTDGATTNSNVVGHFISAAAI